MPKPPAHIEETTVINVKSVRLKAWNRARAAAAHQGEPMGAWLSRAIDQLADREGSTPREFPPPPSPTPDTPARRPFVDGSGLIRSPVSLAPADVADLLQGMAALAVATETKPSRSDVRRAYGLVDAMVRDARGMPQKVIRAGKASGKAPLEIGQSKPEPPQPEPEPEPEPQPPAKRQRGRAVRN